jgi:hypothetical protein
MYATWPVAGEIDENLLKSSAYLDDVAHEFRTRLRNYVDTQNKVCTVDGFIVSV